MMEKDPCDPPGCHRDRAADACTRCRARLEELVSSRENPLHATEESRSYALSNICIEGGR